MHRYDTMLNVFYLASFMFEASGHFKSNFTGHMDVRKIYSDNREQFDSGRYFEQVTSGLIILALSIPVVSTT